MTLPYRIRAQLRQREHFASIERAVTRYFVATGDKRHCVRRETVYAEVARMLGVVHNNSLCKQVQTVCNRLGFEGITPGNKRLYRGVMPVGIDPEAWAAISARLRRTGGKRVGDDTDAT